MRFFSFLLIYILAISCLNGQSGEDFFKLGNDAFDKKDYLGAIKNFEAAIEKGNVGTELFFNLGNSYQKSEMLGKALVNYQRCLLLQPNFQPALNNLKITQAKRADDIESLPPFFIQQWWEKASLFFSSGTWGFLSLLFFWLAIAGIILNLVKSDHPKAKLTKILSPVLLLFAFLFFLLSGHRKQLITENKSGFIIEKEIDLKQAADEISTTIFPIHDGTKVNITDKIGDWYQVKLENGESGWIRSSQMEKI